MPRSRTGGPWRTGRCGSSRSTNAPATSSTSPRRAGGLTTPRIPRRSSPPSTARALLIAGNGDGGFQAIKPQTGEKVVELHRVQAFHQHRRRRQRNHGDRVARRREPRLVGARHDRSDRRRPDGRHQADEVGGQGVPVRLLLASHRWQSCLPDRERVEDAGVRHRDRERTVETGSRDRSEGAAGAGGRQDLRRHRERQVLHPASRPDARRGAERGGTAAQHEQRATGRGHAGADSRRCGHFTRPRLLCVERRGVRVRSEGGQASVRLGDRRGRGQGRGRAGISSGHADRARAEAGTDRQAARPVVRRPRAVPSRGRQGELVSRRAERVGDGWHVRRGFRARRTGRAHQGRRLARCTGRRGPESFTRSRGPKPSRRTRTVPFQRAG